MRTLLEIYNSLGITDEMVVSGFSPFDFIAWKDISSEIRAEILIAPNDLHKASQKIKAKEGKNDRAELPF